MEPQDRQRCDEKECEAWFGRFFPGGLGGNDVFQEIAPEGWEASPLRRVFHPTLEQVFEETLRLYRNLARLSRGLKEHQQGPEPTLESVREGYREEPLDPGTEVPHLVGMCLWDIFSDNHEVFAPDGRVVDLGSWRGSGGFLADIVNRETGSARYDYMDFYMGTAMVGERADLTPLYEMLFRRLRAHGLDWRYEFPRLHVIDLRPLERELEESNPHEPEWAGYCPSEALAEEEKERKREEELAEMRASLEEAHREAIEEARRWPPPSTVVAYQRVYGRFPAGWPPWE